MELLAGVLPLGAPGLRVVSGPVERVDEPGFLAGADRLQRTLAAFRAARGFGRAIAAPQIGVARRFIALHLADAPRLVINPEVTWRSDEAFTMWDDCMCFPWLLVRVRRHVSISIRYTDERGDPREWQHLPLPAAELLQHEIDHLDGVLAIDRALDREAIVSREAYAAAPERFAAQVDYTIAAMSAGEAGDQ
jgi:peptide deformylase